MLEKIRVSQSSEIETIERSVTQLKQELTTSLEEISICKKDS